MNLIDLANWNWIEKKIFFVRVFEVVGDVDRFTRDREIINNVDDDVDAAGVLNDAVKIEEGFDGGAPGIFG